MEQVEDLFVVVEPAGLRHDLLRLHRHLILFVDLNFSFHLLLVQAFNCQLALCNPLRLSFVFVLEADLLL